MTKYQSLFSPLSIKTMTLKNRIVMSPIGSNLALSNGEMSSEHIEYYRLRAAGGVGLIIMENVCVDYPKGCNGTTQLRLDQDCFVPKLYYFNEVMHKSGCCTSVQINHAGCTARPSRIGCAAAAPSKIKLADGSYAEELSIDEIKRLALQYGKAAARAKLAGFDSVEIHAGHGYLINQFLSPIWNHRTDEFGGSTENRARFCRLVIDEIRKAVGNDYPVLMRMSLEEFVEGGNSLEESLRLLEYLKDGVDLIDASVGVKYAMDAAQLPDGWRTFVSKAVKDKFKMPCAVMGNIREPQMADDIIARGDADLVVIGRGLIADPKWPIKAQYGKEADIRPCISCNIGCVSHRTMLDQPIRCTVNPSIMSEELHKRQRVTKKCNVVVVGGGASGLEAACTAAETGCDVTLLEKDGEVGGWLSKISVIPQKYRMKRLLDYMLHRAEGLKNLTIKTNAEVTAESIKALDPDLVVWSVGSVPLLPKIPGLHETLKDKAAPVWDINGFLKNLEEEKSFTGKTIGIAGGGAVALDVAEFFAEQNNRVFIVEQFSDIGRGLDGFTKSYINDVLKEHGSEVYCSHRLEEVLKDRFIVSSDGKRKELLFDCAFICLGLTANTQDNEILKTLEENDIPVMRIGDSKRARRLYEGIHEGRSVMETLDMLGFYEA